VSPLPRDAVAQRSGRRCEYCLLPEAADPYEAFHLEHIVAKQHGGEDDLDNLAWACSRCNFRKGTNLTSIDPSTAAIVDLFHPRRHVWREHFTVRDARIMGVTPLGRATAKLLDMNAQHRVQLRRELVRQGRFDA
jgi:hypothetical protein